MSKAKIVTHLVHLDADRGAFISPEDAQPRVWDSVGLQKKRKTER
jgi:hypothetical protein